MASDDKPREGAHRNVTPEHLAYWHSLPIEKQIKMAWPKEQDNAEQLAK